MNNGTMSGNISNYGGGVCAKNADYTDGVFTMKSGGITGNNALNNGRAVSVSGVFNWEGGSITGHTSGSGDVIHNDSGHFNNNCHGTAS